MTLRKKKPLLTLIDLDNRYVDKTSDLDYEQWREEIRGTSQEE